MWHKVNNTWDFYCILNTYICQIDSKYYKSSSATEGLCVTKMLAQPWCHQLPWLCPTVACGVASWKVVWRSRQGKSSSSELEKEKEKEVRLQSLHERRERSVHILQGTCSTHLYSFKCIFCVPHASSNLLLKIFRAGDSSTCLGSLFHYLTTLSVTKIFLLSNLNLLRCNLRTLLLILLLITWEKRLIPHLTTASF